MIENSSEFPVDIPVCIVGAGPAGTTTSLFLAKMGIPHLIIDKDIFPRDKICGDGLDLKVARVLNNLEKDSAFELLEDTETFSKSWGIRCISPSGFVKDFDYQTKEGEISYPMFCVAKRINFDLYLIKKINRKFANVQFNAELIEIGREEEGLVLTIRANNQDYHVKTKMVIGADGEHSIVQKKMAKSSDHKIDRKHYAAALRQYYKGVEGISDRGHIEIYFPLAVPLCYFWIFPLPNGEANVGFGMLSEFISKRKVNLRKTMADIIQNDPHIAPRFKNAVALETVKGWGLPLASKRVENFGDNYLLIGDASSLICPTTGEGIGTAMISGYIAAHYIQNAIQKNNYSAQLFTKFKNETHKRIENDILKINFIRNSKPEIWLSSALNLFFKYKDSEFKDMPKWLNTAFEKEIEVIL